MSRIEKEAQVFPRPIKLVVPSKLPDIVSGDGRPAKTVRL
jgi:hypothetical protein